jgi:Skp family chaperone for outer membrane proteins
VEEEGYTVILEKNEAGIIYAPEKLNLTEKVIKKYGETAKSSDTKK